VRDAKTRLQEWAQAFYHQNPTYVVVEESGPDHAKEFAVEVLVVGEVRGRGAGSSRLRMLGLVIGNAITVAVARTEDAKLLPPSESAEGFFARGCSRLCAEVSLSHSRVIRQLL